MNPKGYAASLPHNNNVRRFKRHMKALALISNLFGPDGVVILVLVGMIAIPIVVTSWLNKRLHVKQPDVRPFRWGYWIGIGALLAPLVITAQARGDIGVFFFLALIYWPIGVFVFRRQRWALIAATVLSLNPILWIINAFYISHGWSEMSGLSPSVLPKPPVLPSAREYQMRAVHQMRADGIITEEQFHAKQREIRGL